MDGSDYAGRYTGGDADKDGVGICKTFSLWNAILIVTVILFVSSKVKEQSGTERKSFVFFWLRTILQL